MSFPHEVIDALPTATPADKELLRALLTRRFAYCLAEDEAASDYVAKDPVSAIPPLYLIQNGTLYAYDATDSMTSPSAVCLVTSDACRYKSGTIEPPYSVLTYSTTAQPADVDVSDGDTFLLPIGATGADWAGKAGQVAMRVGAKWHFAINPIGRRLYVEDEDRFYYRNYAGVWTSGNGTLAFAANSIPITAIIGAKASFQIKVENQTTNAPPAAPVAPIAYIIGPSPTGAWAGLAGQLAVCLSDGVFTIINPTRGDEVFDKSLNINVKFNGTAWVSAIGAWVGFKPVRTSSGSMSSLAGGGEYPNYAVAPTTGAYHYNDNARLTYSAKRSGAVLRFNYQVNMTAFTGVESGINAVSDDRPAFVALFVDSNVNALEWRSLFSYGATPLTGSPGSINVTFLIDAADTSEHEYYMGILPTIQNNGNNDVFAQIVTFARRSFSVEEAG